MLNVAISGLSYLDHNYGAQGILLPFIKMLQVEEDVHFTVLLTHDDTCDPMLLKEVSYEIIHIPRINFSSLHKLNIIKQIIYKCDVVIDLNGIEFLGDRAFLTKWKDLLNTIYFEKLARKFDKLYLKYSKSYGPFHGFVYKKTIQKHFNSLPFLLVRGEKNSNKVATLNLKIPIYSFPDISFALANYSEKWQKNYVHKLGMNVAEDYICFSPSVVINNINQTNSLAGSNYINFCLKLLMKLQLTGMQVMLLPHSIGDGKDLKHCDLALCRKIYQLHDNKQNIYLIDDLSLSYSKARTLIGAADFYITGRYHSLTSALVNAVPVIPLSWHVKYKDVIFMFTTKDNSINVNKTSSEEAIKKIMICFYDRSWYNSEEMKENKLKVLTKVKESMQLINETIINWRKENA